MKTARWLVYYIIIFSWSYNIMVLIVPAVARFLRTLGQVLWGSSLQIVQALTKKKRCFVTVLHFLGLNSIDKLITLPTFLMAGNAS